MNVSTKDFAALPVFARPEAAASEGSPTFLQGELGAPAFMRFPSQVTAILAGFLMGDEVVVGSDGDAFQRGRAGT